MASETAGEASIGLGIEILSTCAHSFGLAQLVIRNVDSSIEETGILANAAQELEVTCAVIACSTICAEIAASQAVAACIDASSIVLVGAATLRPVYLACIRRDSCHPNLTSLASIFTKPCSDADLILSSGASTA